MDKVLLGAQDIESLFKWRDAHKDEVRTNPSPVRDIEIICKESQVKVKCLVFTGSAAQYGVSLESAVKAWDTLSLPWHSLECGIPKRTSSSCNRRISSRAYPSIAASPP